MESDTQVQKARQFPEKKSLLDVIQKQYDSSGKDPANPFISKVLLCGKHSSEDLKALEEVAKEASLKADLTNPLTSGSEGGNEISSLIIDYGERFLQLIQGYERHVMHFLWELHFRRKALKLEKCIILFMEDDVEGISPPNWIYIPAFRLQFYVVPRKGKRDEDEIAQCVIQDLKMIAELAELGKNETGPKNGVFSESAKMNHTKLFPKEENTLHYLKSDLFLTLQEYEKNFRDFPDYTRDIEISHPIEDPLKY